MHRATAARYPARLRWENVKGRHEWPVAWRRHATRRNPVIGKAAPVGTCPEVIHSFWPAPT